MNYAWRGGEIHQRDVRVSKCSAHNNMLYMHCCFGALPGTLGMQLDCTNLLQIIPGSEIQPTEPKNSTLAYQSHEYQQRQGVDEPCYVFFRHNHGVNQSNDKHECFVLHGSPDLTAPT